MSDDDRVVLEADAAATKASSDTKQQQQAQQQQQQQQASVIPVSRAPSSLPASVMAAISKTTAAATLGYGTSAHIPVLVLCHNRPEYLDRTLQELIKYA